MPNLLTQHGAQPQKQPKYVPIFIDRTFTGIYTQRAVLHDPSDIYTSRYYGGRPDALWMGQNIELTNRLTLQRRPGLTQFSTFPYPTPPLRSYPFQLLDGTIRVIIDTGTSGNLSITSVTAGSGSAVYTGAFPAGASNAYVGLIFSVSGCTSSNNNNTTTGFVCTASTATTLTLANTSGGTTEAESGAVAVTSGEVFWDQQNGSAVLLFGKAVGAGQTYFVAVAGILYMGDGVDTKKYTPANTNATITSHTAPQPSTTTNTVWNWGGVAPSTPLATVVTASGSAAGTWQANTWFSTMGVIIDSNGNIQQLTGITNATVANTIGNVGLIGLSSSGGPTWVFTPGQSTTDGSVVWRCLSAIKARVPSGTLETETTAYSTNGFDSAYYEQKSGNIYVCIHTTGSAQNFGGQLQGLSLAPGQTFDDGNNTMMSLGNAPGASPAQNNMPNGYAQGQWKPSQVIPSQANPPIRLIIPFTIPQPGFPLSQTLYLFEQTQGGTTSASGNVPWASFVGKPTTESAGTDGSILTWTCVTAYGSLNGMTGQWVANQNYTFWNSPQNGGFGVVKDKDTNPSGAGTGTSLWVAVSNASPGTPGIGTSSGSDPFTKYYYQRGGHSYSILDKIVDNFGNIQEVSVAGTSGATAPSWDRHQGNTTTDNGTLRWINKGSACGRIKVVDNDIQWINIGAAVNCVWTANQKFYLPTSGFNAPLAVPFGSIDINDGTNIEYVARTGVSGGSIPSWNASIQPGSNETYDPSPPASGSVTWYNNGPFKQSSLSWTKSHTWAYSYKARSTTDFYSVASGTPPTIPVPPGSPAGSTGLPNPPSGSQANTITTASPATTIFGASSGTVIVTLYGNYSADPQFDTIIIWRDPDGVGSSGSSGMLELTEIPNIPALAGSGKYVVNGVAYDWFFNDFLPDTPTGSFPGLNPLIQAPINHLNDPPFSSYRPMEYNFQRIWGSYLLQVNFSAGPDESATAGNPNEAFPPAYELPFLAPVQRLVRTPQGLIVLTTDSIELIAGGPLTQTFYSVRLSAGMGLLSFNALDTYAGEIFFFSSDNQFYLLSPSLSVSNFGFPLGDQFANMPSSGVSDATWDPAKVYVAVHQSGIDNCMFVCDGSTGWYRLNPRQVPGAAQGPEPIWSPFAILTGGAQMVQSVEYVPGKKSLLVGGTGAGQTISKRTLGVYTDNGTQYSAFYIMGSIVLAHPGQLALLKFLEGDFSGAPNVNGVGFRPTISYLLNEISGTFTPFVAAPQFDPPAIYGARIFPKSYSPNRYYFASNAVLARCRHLQLKVDYGVSPNGDEVYDLTIYGRIVVEF